MPCPCSAACLVSAEMRSARSIGGVTLAAASRWSKSTAACWSLFCNCCSSACPAARTSVLVALLF
eukprot:7489637-Lingulodinium_polyedra.AAC.1